MRELAQLLVGALRLLERLADERARLPRLTFERLLRQLERDHRVDEALLGSVVQVAHDPPPLLVGGRHDPRARGGELRAGVDVRDRRGDEPGELPHPGLHYAFTNTLSEEESAEIYERYHIAAPGRFIWDGFLSNVTPGHQDTWVNFDNDERAPLLFIAGSVDHVMPAAVNRSNYEHYTSAAHTDYKEFAGRSHYTVGQPGWEEVADYALDWCNEHTGRGVLHYGATPGFD